MSAVTALARAGLDVTRRATEVVLALPRIAIALERLATTGQDLRRLADASDEVRRLLASASAADVALARETLARLTEAVGSLNSAVGSLNTTLTPLQGATERLGRLVDRFPQSRRSRVLDVEPGGPR